MLPEPARERSTICAAAISILNISAPPPAAVTPSTIFSANSVLPMPGRPATTIKSCRLMPPVASSSSSMPVFRFSGAGFAVHAFLYRFHVGWQQIADVNRLHVASIAGHVQQLRHRTFDNLIALLLGYWPVGCRRHPAVVARPCGGCAMP